MTGRPDDIDEWFSAPTVPPLTGAEELHGVDGAQVVDFWRFAMSDLRMNNVRGYLAEYLVARTVGATGTRIEWDAYDVLAPDGTRIEVKSSAYLQVWEQRKLSRIEFAGLRGATWDRYGVAPVATYNVDVYVFCVQTATTHDTYDPLDVDQWRFYVLSRQAVEATGYGTLSLRRIETMTDALPCAELGKNRGRLSQLAGRVLTRRATRGSDSGDAGIRGDLLAVAEPGPGVLDVGETPLCEVLVITFVRTPWEVGHVPRRHLNLGVCPPRAAFCCLTDCSGPARAVIGAVLHFAQLAVHASPLRSGEPWPIMLCEQAPRR